LIDPIREFASLSAHVVDGDALVVVAGVVARKRTRLEPAALVGGALTLNEFAEWEGFAGSLIPLAVVALLRASTIPPLTALSVVLRFAFALVLGPSTLGKTEFFDSVSSRPPTVGVGFTHVFALSEVPAISEALLLGDVPLAVDRGERASDVVNTARAVSSTSVGCIVPPAGLV
jgi:hypothetical protein